MDTQTLQIGTLLDSGIRRYQIMEVLGHGGFGITYKAQSRIRVDNIELKAFFAIKEHFIKQYNDREGCIVTTPNKSNAADVNDSLQAFRTEAQRLNRLSLKHPGIVKVNECFDANGTAYYVMEFVEGQDLRDYVEHHDGGRLPEDKAISIIRKVGNSLAYLHDHQVTHLDVKPDNILLRDEGMSDDLCEALLPYPQLKATLIDFGLAKHYDSKGRATSTLKVTGTSDGYSPIEQYAGIDSFSPQADVYALAATLLFMLTGRDPKKAVNETEEHIRQSLAGVASLKVADAIVHAMQMKPLERTQTTESFLNELRGYQFIDIEALSFSKDFYKSCEVEGEAEEEAEEEVEVEEVEAPPLSNHHSKIRVLAGETNKLNKGKLILAGLIATFILVLLCCLPVGCFWKNATEYYPENLFSLHNGLPFIVALLTDDYHNPTILVLSNTNENISFLSLLFWAILAAHIIVNILYYVKPSLNKRYIQVSTIIVIVFALANALSLIISISKYNNEYNDYGGLSILFHLVWVAILLLLFSLFRSKILDGQSQPASASRVQMYE